MTARTAVRVPEAPADVDDLPMAREDQIGSAGEVANVEAIAESERVDKPAYDHLRSRVFRPNR
jgi:hypothetical protein